MNQRINFPAVLYLEPEQMEALADLQKPPLPSERISELACPEFGIYELDRFDGTARTIKPFADSEFAFHGELDGRCWNSGIFADIFFMMPKKAKYADGDDPAPLVEDFRRQLEDLGLDTDWDIASHIVHIEGVSRS